MKLLSKIIRKLQNKTYPYIFQQNKIKNFVLKQYGQPQKRYPKIDISMLTLNRLQDTKRTLDSLYETTLDFNLILIDQNSDDGTREFVQQFAKFKDNVELRLLNENVGVSGGRALAANIASTDFLAFVDNDMVFMPGYFENLLETLESSKNIAGVSGKSVKPDELIEVNSPTLIIDEGWAWFNDDDAGKQFNDSSSLKVHECFWIPMGVSMWRTDVLQKIPIDAELIGAYEDNEYTYRISKSGYRLMNCPSSVVLHIKAEFTKAMGDKNYTQGRFNNDKLKFAVKRFYSKHKLYLAFGNSKEDSCKYLGFNSPEEYIEFLQS